MNNPPWKQMILKQLFCMFCLNIARLFESRVSHASYLCMTRGFYSLSWIKLEEVQQNWRFFAESNDAIVRKMWSVPRKNESNVPLFCSPASLWGVARKLSKTVRFCGKYGCFWPELTSWHHLCLFKITSYYVFFPMGNPPLGESILSKSKNHCTIGVPHSMVDHPFLYWNSHRCRKFKLFSGTTILAMRVKTLGYTLYPRYPQIAGSWLFPHGNFMGFDPTPCIIMYPYHISTITDSFPSGHENFQHAWPSPMEPMAEVFEANVIPTHTETRGSHRPRPTAEWRTGHKKETYIDIHIENSERNNQYHIIHFGGIGKGSCDRTWEVKQVFIIMKTMNMMNMMMMMMMIIIIIIIGVINHTVFVVIVFFGYSTNTTITHSPRGLPGLQHWGCCVVERDRRDCRKIPKHPCAGIHVEG